MTDEGKTQSIRLLDVFFVGPVMTYGGWHLRKRHPALSVTLAALGVMTVVYNGRNYLRIREELAQVGR